MTLLLGISSALADHLQVNCSDFTLTPTASRRVALTPTLITWVTNGWLIPPDPRVGLTDTNGVMIISNALPGAYKLTISGSANSADKTWLLVVGAGTSLVNAASCVVSTAPTNPAAYYTAAAADTRFQAISERAATNGYASLDATGRIPTNQIPTNITASVDLSLTNRFQPGSANLTNWAELGTNAVTAKLSSNVWAEAWGALATNAISDKLESNVWLGFVTALTNAPMRVLFEGDSLTAGGIWSGYLTNTWSRYITVTNAAHSGDGLATVTNEWATQVQPYADTNTVLSLWIGANDLPISDFDAWATAWSNYVYTATTNGFRVVAFTVMPQDYTLQNAWRETNRVRMNNLILQSTLPWRVVDVAARFPNPLDTQWVSDGTHLTTNGYAVVADMFNAAVGGATPLQVVPRFVEASGTNIHFAGSDGVRLATLHKGARLSTTTIDATNVTATDSVSAQYLRADDNFEAGAGGSVVWGAKAITPYSTAGLLSWDTGLITLGALTDTDLSFRIEGVDRIYVSKTFGYVGISTNAPSSRLHVGNGGDLNVDGAIVTGGKVGIGTNSPKAALHVGNDGNAIVDGWMNVSGVLSNAGGAVIRTAVGGPTNQLTTVPTNGTEGLSVLSSGKVRIGTTNRVNGVQGTLHLPDGTNFYPAITFGDGTGAKTNGLYYDGAYPGLRFVGIFIANAFQSAGSIILGNGGSLWSSAGSSIAAPRFIRQRAGWEIVAGDGTGTSTNLLAISGSFYCTNAVIIGPPNHSNFTNNNSPMLKVTAPIAGPYNGSTWAGYTQPIMDVQYTNSTSVFGVASNGMVFLGHIDASNSPAATSVGLFCTTNLNADAKGELYVVDGNGTITLLSPHAEDAPAWLYDNADGMPDHVTSERQPFTGTLRWVNETRRARLMEMLLNGEDMSKLPAEKKRVIYTETFADYGKRTGRNLATLDWTKAQADAQAQYDQKRANTAAMIAEAERKNDEIDAINETGFAMPYEPVPAALPVMDVKRPLPAWIKQ